MSAPARLALRAARRAPPALAGRRPHHVTTAALQPHIPTLLAPPPAAWHCFLRAAGRPSGRVASLVVLAWASARAGPAVARADSAVTSGLKQKILGIEADIDELAGKVAPPATGTDIVPRHPPPSRSTPPAITPVLRGTHLAK